MTILRFQFGYTSECDQVSCSETIADRSRYYPRAVSKTEPQPRGPPPRRSDVGRSHFSSIYLAVSAPLLAYFLLPSLSVPDLSRLAAIPGALSKSHDATCPAQVPALDVGRTWNPEEDEDYVKLATERLQGALRIVRPVPSFFPFSRC